MAGRYLVSGVQLGMLCGMEDIIDRKNLLHEIEDKQFIDVSKEDIEKDSKKVAAFFNK
jgi:hypothetical protein